MRGVDFVFAVHDHQPVGNFEYVLEDIYRRAYAPFLAALERHPAIHCTLHRSGSLWEWTERRHPEHVDRVGDLVGRGQIELLSGAYYDPLLPAISERDRRGQIDKQNEYLDRRFGVRPRGAWVAERVWEPHVGTTLVESGIHYVFLDDAHFEAAGVPAGALDGWYFTEHGGAVLRVLPIHAALRYRLPFASPEEALAVLAGFRRDAAPAAADLSGLRPPAGTAAPDARPAALAVHADDGEKFGAWPGTHARCYEEGWLDRFFELVESNAAWLWPVTASQSLERAAARGATVMPAAAYPEFETWALDPQGQRELQRLRSQLAADPGSRFLRGGSWRRFLMRYPESNWMHKRVLRASDAVWRRIESHGATLGALRARDEVWRAQCNCAYWHGLFGGLYLSHLRSSVYGAVLRAERWLADGASEPVAESLDVDADGQDEIVLRSADLQAFVKPDAGGMVVELDDRMRGFNLIDTLARREEAYHRHDALAGEARHAFDYDRYRRGAALEHLLAPEATLDDFLAARLPVLSETATQAFDWVLDGEAVRLERVVALRLPQSPRLHLEKHLRLRGPVLDMRWELWHEGSEPIELRLGIEIVANFQAGDAPDRYYAVPGRELDDRRLASAGSLEDVQRIDFVDEWQGIRARVETDAPCTVWRGPIETVSSSENGLERLFQGSALLLVSPLRLDPLERAVRQVTWTIERT